MAAPALDPSRSDSLRLHRPTRAVAWLGLASVAVALVAVGAYFSIQSRGAPAGFIDAPADGAVLASPTSVSGWAIDQAARGNTGVDGVELFVDGTWVASADYGLGRPDIGGSLGRQFSASGWSAQLDPHTLSAGQHTLEARARSIVTGRQTSYSRTIVVQPPSAPAVTAPRGAIDLPAEDELVGSTVDVDGWAIDESASGGTGVDRVRLYVDGELVGEAMYGSTRDEIGSAYGTHFGPSGWTVRVDLSGRAPGRHTLEARARSALTGAETTYVRGLTLQP